MTTPTHNAVKVTTNYHHKTTTIIFSPSPKGELMDVTLDVSSTQLLILALQDTLRRLS